MPAWEGFGWNVHNIDGHDFEAIHDSFTHNHNNKKPKVIITNTIKGKGISFMEGKPNWHYWNQISDQELSIARDELKKEINIYE